MAAFIDDRVERRGLRRATRAARRVHPDRQPRRRRGARRERYAAVLFHVAGCDDCWAAWHARRRTLLTLQDGRARADRRARDRRASGRSSPAWPGVQGQATTLLARLGIGGAAAAGGGAATFGGKATAVCVGIVCAATAGTELAGVLPPIAPEPARETRVTVARPKPAAAASAVVRRTAASAAPRATAPPAPAQALRTKVAVRAALAAPEATWPSATAGALPPARASRAEARSTRPASASPGAAATSRPFAATSPMRWGLPPDRARPLRSRRQPRRARLRDSRSVRPEALDADRSPTSTHGGEHAQTTHGEEPARARRVHGAARCRKAAAITASPARAGYWVRTSCVNPDQSPAPSEGWTRPFSWVAAEPVRATDDVWAR